jgi:UDP-glucose 4-epimerase
MKILVTGGAGFIGSSIVDAYVNAGHKVTVIDNESSGKKSHVNAQARYCRLNIADEKQLTSFFRGKRFDVVNHHAAQIDVRKSVENPRFDATVNILGLLNVLERCRENNVKKIIFSSSGGTVYGECKRPAKETDPEVPLSPYGVAKLASEKYIKTYASLYGIRYTIFRYSNVYGPRQDPHGEAGVVAIFSNKLLRNEIPTIYGNGRQSRDFVFVGDVVRANLMALRKADMCVVNIGIGKETSINALYKIMAQLRGEPRKPHYKAGRPGELQRSVLNASLAKKVLGWSPQDSLETGLGKTLKYFQAQLEKR